MKDNKRRGWSARDVFAFGLHALDNGCRTSSSPGHFVALRHDLGDVTRFVTFGHDGTAYGTTVEHATWTTTDKRWFNPDDDAKVWSDYLAIPTPEEKRS